MQNLVLSILFVLNFTCLIFSQTSEQTDQSKVEASVNKWVENTIMECDTIIYSNFISDYTDDYNISKMRLDIINRELLLEETDSVKIVELEKQKTKITKELQNFHPKVKSYSIDVKAISNYNSPNEKHSNYTIIINDFYQIVKIIDKE